MIAPDDLLDFALRALASDDVSETHARRAVSAAYYALLHTIAQAGGMLFSGNEVQRQRTARSYNHNALVRAAKKVDSAQGKAALDGGSDLREVARILLALNQARERADYDLLSELNWSDADRLIGSALDACRLVQLIKGESHVIDFLLEPLFPERGRG